MRTVTARPAWATMWPCAFRQTNISVVTKQQRCKAWGLRSLAASPTPCTRRPRLGQPAPWSHPHLFQADGANAPSRSTSGPAVTSDLAQQITPGVSRAEYERRRRALMASVPVGGVAIVGGYGLRYKANGIFYPFAQAADMAYLTGVHEPDAAAVLVRTADTHSDTSASTSILSSPRNYRMTLFLRGSDQQSELWDGPRCALHDVDYFGADEGVEIARLSEWLARELPQYRYVYTDLALDRNAHAAATESQNASSHATAVVPAAADPSLCAPIRALSIPTYLLENIQTKPLRSKIDRLRVFKSEEEFKLMKKAGHISGKAFIQMMKATQSGKSEAQLWAVLEYEARMRGGSGLAYVPVVAGGHRGLTLHYVANNALLSHGDMVLVDAGAEYNGYACDITRTYPVSGKFTEPQRMLYEAVLQVQKQAITYCRADANVSLNKLHERATVALRETLETLLDTRLSRMDINRLFPHHLAHYIGMDVHDTDTVSRSVTLQEGMVVTIEPGVYIPVDDVRFPKEFRGLAVRIEDTVYVGERQPVVLSSTAPKEVLDIEGLMQGITTAWAGV